jgi:MFS family permease
MFFLVLFLQQVAGYSALGAGVALMPITLIMFALASRFGALADRIGPRIPMTAGPLVGGAGLMMLLGVDAEADYTTSVLPAVIVFGIGLAMTVAPLTATVLAAAPERRAGVASGLNNAVTRVGALLAIAAVGAAVSAQFSSTLEDDLSAEALSADALAAVASAKLRPLTVAVDVPGLGSQESSEIEESTSRAAVTSFHLAIAISAGLVMVGGLLSAVWVRGRPKGLKPAAGLPIGPLPATRAGTRT